MARAIPALAPILILLMVAPACSGPSAPSPAPSVNPTPALTTTAAEPGAPVSAAASGGFEFLGSDPGPGSEIAVEDLSGTSQILRTLTARLALHFNQSLPDALVEVELFGDNGRQCAYGFIDRPIVAGHVYAVSNAFWNWQTQDCGSFPVSTVTLKATLLTLRAQRTDYVIQTFPVRYTIRRYPPPPGGPDAPPTISRLDLLVFDPVAGAPAPGDPIGLSCTGKEADGAPVTVRITQRWEGRAPVVHTKAFGAGASSSPSGAIFEIFLVTLNPARATIECAVTNDRGQHAVQTINIPLSR